MFKPFSFVYTHAIVSRVPNSIKESAFKQKGPLNAIELNAAREQHSDFISVLRKLGLDVIELQADETLPDSLFIDCNAIILNGIALLTKPYLASRKKETDIVKCILKKEGLHVIEIQDPIATLDASDVLFTGREFFVGISKRTNIIGAKALAAAFPDVHVSSIKIKRGLFLKAYVSVAGTDLLAFSNSEVAKDILKQMKEIAEHKNYKIITLPQEFSSNCLYMNGTLLHCAQSDYPQSFEVFVQKIDHPRIEIKNSEFIKLKRFLTCRCLLFSKSQLIVKQVF